MLFVVSGEGPTDIGTLVPDVDRWQFAPGPMTHAIDQLVEAAYKYSIVAARAIRFKSEHDLTAYRQTLDRRHLRLPRRGEERGEDTGYFERSAYLLGLIAREVAAEEGTQDVVAILFRDADGTHSTRSDNWDAKLASMVQGFTLAGFTRGVPMVPRPKSEAWLLCALKEPPYANGDALEAAAGNDAARESLKTQLERRLGHEVSRQSLNDLVAAHPIEFAKIRMPSFRAFKRSLGLAIGREDLVDTDWGA